MITIENLNEILTAVDSAENQKRKAYEYKSFQIYEGSLRYYVEQKLRKLYPETYMMFQVSDYSILKKIVDKKAKAYKETPLRTLDNDSETTLYQEIVKKYSLNEAMKSIDKLFNQHKYCLLSVFFERVDVGGGQIKEQFKFIPLAPYEFDVVLGESGELLCVVLSYPDEQVVSGKETDNQKQIIAGPIQDKGKDKKKTYAVWTEKNHWIIEGTQDVNGSRVYSKITMEKNPLDVNPYGIIPFAYLPIDFCSEYPVSSPLAHQAVEMNSEISTYYTSGMMQIGTLVMKFPSSQAIEFVTQGLFTGIKLPQSENPDSPETSADYISPSPNLSGHKEAILTHMGAILDEHGIGSNQVLKPNESFSSGFERLLASADVQDIIEDNQGFYSKIENKVYQIVKSIYKNFIKRDVFKSEELRVIYKRPRVMISDTEKLQNIKTMDELNILLPWEKFMMIDPNLSVDEAKEKWSMVQQEKAKALAMLASDDEDEE
jgi:hypothetical protein